MTEKRKYRKREYYPFVDMAVGDHEVFWPLESRNDAILIRCAAHSIGYLHHIRFKTKIREMDSGEFEINVRRVE